MHPNGDRGLGILFNPMPFPQSACRRRSGTRWAGGSRSLLRPVDHHPDQVARSVSNAPVHGRPIILTKSTANPSG